MISERIAARLKTANIAPIMDTQFLIDEGSFINIFLKTNIICNDSASLLKVVNNSTSIDKCHISIISLINTITYRLK